MTIKLRAAPARSSRPKIGILTFHRCFNYGSYWQARCLVEGLRAAGHDAELLDHDCRRARLAEERCLFQPTLPERTPPGDLPLYKAKGRKFIEALRRLPRSARFSLDRPEELRRYDIVVVGSDEVWNFRHPWYGSHPVFFGDGLKASRLVSYAASFGNHDATDGIDPSWGAKLRQFAAISVRDANSSRLVRDAIGTEPDLVLDPCLQFARFLETPPASLEAPYALVYGHGFPDWLSAAVQRWSRLSDVRLVSVGYRNGWTDEQQIGAGPIDFARLMAGARAVITNFFHGCVFALLHRTPFISAPSDYRFNKVRDLAAAVGAERRLVDRDTSPARLRELLELPVQKAVVDRIEELRQRSAVFFHAALA